MPTENITKNITKGITERMATTKSTATTHAVRIDAGMTVLIISRTFLRVREHFVGFFDFFEFFFRVWIILIAVGMVFHREFAVGLFNFGFVCIACDI